MKDNTINNDAIKCYLLVTAPIIIDGAIGFANVHAEPISEDGLRIVGDYGNGDPIIRYASCKWADVERAVFEVESELNTVCDSYEPVNCVHGIAELLATIR